MPKNTVLGGPSIATDDDQEVTEWDGTSSSTSSESQPTPSSEVTTSNEEPAVETESLSEAVSTDSSDAPIAAKPRSNKR